MKTFRFAGELGDKHEDGLYWVQALRVGGWNYPEGDDHENGFDLNEDILREMKRRFDAGEKAGGDGDLPVRDETHKRGENDCGWIKAVQLRDNDRELWVGFEITSPETKEKVDTKTLKYASSEIDLAWVNPEACRLKGDCAPRKVLEAVALVNHPYIKGMAPIEVPINLSEDFGIQVSAGTARRKCSCQHGRSKTQGGNMPELEEVMKELGSLKALLEETRKDAGGSTALSEKEKALESKFASMQRSLQETQHELQIKDLKAQINTLFRKGKLSAPVANKAIRLGTFLIRTNNSIVLAEEGRPVKLKLAEDQKEEALDKLDVIGEVVDMLGQLPDAIATASPEDTAKLEEDCYDMPGTSAKSDDQQIRDKAKAMAEKDPTGFGKKPIEERYKIAASELGLDTAARRSKTPMRGGSRGEE